MPLSEDWMPKRRHQEKGLVLFQVRENEREVSSKCQRRSLGVWELFPLPLTVYHPATKIFYIITLLPVCLFVCLFVGCFKGTLEILFHSSSIYALFLKDLRGILMAR